MDTWGLRFILNSTPKRFEKISRDIFSLAKYSKDLTQKIRVSEEFSYDESTDGTIKLFSNEVYPDIEGSKCIVTQNKG